MRSLGSGSGNKAVEVAGERKLVACKVDLRKAAKGVLVLKTCEYIRKMPRSKRNRSAGSPTNLVW